MPKELPKPELLDVVIIKTKEMMEFVQIFEDHYGFFDKVNERLN